MEHYVVSSGTKTISKSTSDTYTINGSGALYISSGGLVKNSYVDASGYIRVYKGGIGSHSYIISGGLLYIESGGTTLQDRISSGGRYCVSSAGVAKGLTILLGGTATVFGGEALNADVQGGTLVLYTVTSGSGYSYAYAPVLGADAIMIVQSGARTLEPRISSGAKLNVSYGGRVSSATVSSGGILDNGGSAFDTILSSGGWLRVSSNGYASNTKVLAGCSLTTSKGARTFATSASGGIVDLEGSSFSGTYSNTVVNVMTSGGYSLNESFLGSSCKLRVLGSGTSSGSVESATVGRGATVMVEGGRFDGIVSSGGTFTVLSGIADVKSAVNGALRATVSNGIFWGASCTISSAAIVSGGSINLTNAAIVSSASIMKGRMNLLSGAVVSSADISKNGAIGVSSGGKVIGGTVEGTFETALGASTTSMSVMSGGTANIGGIANRMDVSGGRLTVESGGSVTTAYFSSGALGVVNGTIVFANVGSGCPLQVSSGGSVSSATISSGGRINLNQGKLGSAYVAKGGILSVNSGGSTGSCNVYGSAVVSYGGSATGLSVSSGGWLAVSAYGVAGGCTVYGAGTAVVYSGGSFNSATVSQGGSVTLNNSAVALSCTVRSGGVAKISSGALYNNFKVLNGGKVTGNYDCYGITFSSGGNADIDIYNLSGGNTNAVVSNLYYARNKGTVFTLTVGASQKEGVYKLADNASGFNETITVQNIYGDKRGTLTIGQTVNIGSKGYTLNVDSNNVLCVTVGAAVTGTAKGDIDGNGVSDVLFQYTGGDYQLGYWMNGTNEWRGQGLAKPAAWEVLGSYDMNNNGKADSVLVGNVEVGGVKGAYIGYYLDSVDKDANWVNIGYLNNEENIAWKNKVGNLTGNAGMNSIVWYAPELYALGVWTDGTTDWLTLGNTFGGSDWTLVGCGDFNGDGKDSVVMSYNNGQLIYTAGIGASPASLGSTNWSGWEIRAIGDFAGDGKDDLVLFHKTLGSMVICANGNIDSYKSIGQLDANDWFVVGAGDYNGDSMDDLLVRQKSTGMLGYYSGGDTSKWIEMGRGVDTNWTVIA